MKWRRVKVINPSSFFLCRESCTAKPACLLKNAGLKAGAWSHSAMPKSSPPEPGGKHVLPDRLKPGLKLVFCGTAAGRQSALQQAYYAHGQNKFWKTLHEVGLTPRRFAAHDYEKLWELGIGLTDIAKYAFGMDHQLPAGALGPEAVAALEARIRKVKPAILAFTSLNGGRKVMGKNAAAGEQPERLGETRVFILPSPSPLADNHWDIKPWRALARAFRKL
jgi:double-stranded uracil-DNA glycosylase